MKHLSTSPSFYLPSALLKSLVLRNGYGHKAAVRAIQSSISIAARHIGNSYDQATAVWAQMVRNRLLNEVKHLTEGKQEEEDPVDE